MFRFRLLLPLFLGLVLCPLLLAADEVDSLLEMDFQDLVQVKITTVNRLEERLFDSAAAVFVLTSEDIRRASANSIPDLLRLVPGLNVAQSGSSSWAISARGFQDRFADKMLVMVDGRSVYTIGFGGVYWEHLDFPLNDIQQIEVIRGPGGSVWGANAVNGVINIITKNSVDTSGWHVRAGSGNEQRGFGSVRYGAIIDKDASYRIYARGREYDEVDGESSNRGQTFNQDDSTHLQTGFRVDGKPGKSSEVTVQGDLFKFDGDAVLRVPDYDGIFNGSSGTKFLLGDRDTEGANILARWTEAISDRSELVVQTFVDWFDSDSPLARQRTVVYDLDIQHNYRWSKNFTTSTGVDGRVYSDTIEGNQVMIEPGEDHLPFIDGFLNADILLTDAINVNLGSKIGHNDYTGWEVQPSARSMFKLSDSQRIWAAISRAVRVPDRFNNGANYVNELVPPGPPTGLPTQIVILGNRDLDAEVLLSYELGYRLQATRSLYFDIATFYNSYDEVITILQGMPVPTANPFPSVVVPGEQENGGEVTLYGGEIVSTAEVSDRWKLIGSYGFLAGDTSYPDTTLAVIGAESDDAFIQNQALLRSLWNVSKVLELDTTLRFVDSYRPARNDTLIDSYLAVDCRIGWHLSESVELAFIGQNIFDAAHEEQGNLALNPLVAIERSFYWRLDIDL